MGQTNVTEIIKNRIRNQKTSDRRLKLFLILFIAGNLFFLTSTYTLPTLKRDVTPTQIGETVDVGEKIVTFDSWGYSKKDRLFEILLEVENVSLDGKGTLDFRCKSGRNFYKVTIDRVIDDSLYVLHVKHAPRRFYSASLTITSKDGEEESASRIYITDKTVGKVSSATKDQEYLIFAARAKIKGYKSQIRALKKKQEESGKKIENSVELINSLELKKKTQTESEQEETNETINKISYEAESLQGELEQMTLDIQELEAKIKNQEEYIRTVEQGGGGD